MGRSILDRRFLNVQFTIVLCAALALAGLGPARAQAPADMMVASPSISNAIYNVTKYGAVGDGKTTDTAALQRAIDACSGAGGGTVLVPAGRYLTGPLSLASKIDLKLDKGAELLLSDNTADYKLTGDPGRQRFQDCITAHDCHDLAITGNGTIDGQGAMWWANYVQPGKPHRPFLVVLDHCQRVLVQGVTLENSPMFHLYAPRCQDLRVEGVTIHAPENAKNTDGFDPSGWNILANHCTFDVGDDCIAVKPSHPIVEGEPSCKNILIENCTFLHGHGMSIGGQTPGGLVDMTVRDCKFDGTDAGIRMKAPRGQGGLVEKVLYDNLTMKDVKIPILVTSYYEDNSPGATPVDPAQDMAQAVTPTTPIWRHIAITNVTATGARTCGEIYGLPEMPVSDITLTNVSISGRHGFEIIHAKDIAFHGSHVAAQVGAPVVLEDASAQGIGRDGNATASDTEPPAGVRIFNIRQYGAVGDGNTMDTLAISRAIAACSAAGGGRVEIPAGTYLTGPITLASHVDLHVDSGARVLFSKNHDDYPLIVTQYEGLTAVRCESPINGDNLVDVSITGDGTFDGQGETWRPAKKEKLPDAAWQMLNAQGGYVDPSGTWWPSEAAFEGVTAVPKLQDAGDQNAADYQPYRDFLRPTLVDLSNCKNVTLDGPTFENSPAWNLHILLSDDVKLLGVTSLNPWWAQNGDGIDIDSCRHVQVVNSTFNAGDDGICLKSGKDEAGRKLGRPTSDVRIDHCTVYRGHGGVVIGSEMSGGVSDIVATNCYFDGTDMGLRFKTTRGRGGVVENVTADTIDMKDIRGPAISFDMYYEVKNPKPEPVSVRTPSFRNFTIKNIDCEGAQTAMVIRGLPEMPISNITLQNVTIASDQGVSLVDAKDITLQEVRVVAATGPWLSQTDVTGLKMDRVQGQVASL